jgi:hypothetical protein
MVFVRACMTAMDNFNFFLKFIPGFNQFCELCNINLFQPVPTKYLRDVILKSLETRKKSGERRNDLIDLMLDCIKDEDNSGEKKSEEEGNQFYQDQQFSHTKKTS